MLNWMRDPEKANVPTIRTGLVDLCEYLTKELRGFDSLTMYELGSFAGESAEIFAEYFDHVHCVDPWQPPYDAQQPEPDEEVERAFDERAAKFGNIIKHKCGSLDIVTSIAFDSLHFVYVDAAGTDGHSYTRALSDIKAWWPKVKPGCFIGGHDCGAEGVRRAVAEFFGRGEDRDFADMSWIVRKV